MGVNKRFLEVNVDHKRGVSVATIVTFLVVHTILSSFYNLVVFRNHWLNFIERGTESLIGATLIVNLLSIALLIGVGLIAMAKLRLTDIGLELWKLRTGLLVVFGVWIFMQLVAVVVNLVQTSSIPLNPWWETKGPNAMLGGLLGQVFGNALYEEIAFRGFLLTQLYKHLRNKWQDKVALPLTIALVLSQAVFSLAHIPNRIYGGLSLLEMIPQFPMLLFLGSIFAIVYYRTGNLFIAVGIHALANTPTYIPATGTYGHFLPYVAATFIIAAWPRIKGLVESRGGVSAPPLAGSRHS